MWKFPFRLYLSATFDIDYVNQSNDNKMSKSVFSVLDNSDHDVFLRPYRRPQVDCLSACELLATKIRKLCDQYNNGHERKKAAQTIVRFLRAVKDKKLFRDLKMEVNNLRSRDPKALLRLVNDAHSEIFDKNFWAIIFRLNGEQFPPKIVYKLVPLMQVAWGRGIIANAQKLGRWHLYYVYRCSACKIPTATFLRPAPPIKRSKSKKEFHWMNAIY